MRRIELLGDLAVDILLFRLLFGFFEEVFLLAHLLVEEVERRQFAFSVLFDFGEHLLLLLGPLQTHFDLHLLSVLLQLPQLLHLLRFLLRQLLSQYSSLHLLVSK